MFFLKYALHKSPFYFYSKQHGCFLDPISRLKNGEGSPKPPLQKALLFDKLYFRACTCRCFTKVTISSFLCFKKRVFYVFIPNFAHVQKGVKMVKHHQKSNNFTFCVILCHFWVSRWGQENTHAVSSKNRRVICGGRIFEKTLITTSKMGKLNLLPNFADV